MQSRVEKSAARNSTVVWVFCPCMGRGLYMMLFRLIDPLLAVLLTVVQLYSVANSKA